MTYYTSSVCVPNMAEVRLGRKWPRFFSVGKQRLSCFYKAFKTNWIKRVKGNSMTNAPRRPGELTGPKERWHQSRGARVYSMTSVKAAVLRDKFCESSFVFQVEACKGCNCLTKDKKHTLLVSVKTKHRLLTRQPWCRPWFALIDTGVRVLAGKVRKMAVDDKMASCKAKKPNSCQTHKGAAIPVQPAVPNAVSTRTQKTQLKQFKRAVRKNGNAPFGTLRKVTRSGKVIRRKPPVLAHPDENCTQSHVPSRVAMLPKVLSGGKIALQLKANRKYCTGGSTLMCVADRVSSAETFTVACLSDCGQKPLTIGSVVTLRSSGGRYCRGSSAGTFCSAIKADGKYAKFLVVDAGQGYVGMKAGSHRCPKKATQLGEVQKASVWLQVGR